MRDWTQYDAVAVYGVVNVGVYTVGAVYGQDIRPEFFTVYLRHVSGTVEAVRDFSRRNSAVQYAHKLGSKRGLPVADYTTRK